MHFKYMYLNTINCAIKMYYMLLLYIKDINFVDLFVVFGTLRKVIQKVSTYQFDNRVLKGTINNRFMRLIQFFSFPNYDLKNCHMT